MTKKDVMVRKILMKDGWNTKMTTTNKRLHN